MLCLSWKHLEPFWDQVMVHSFYLRLAQPVSPVSDLAAGLRACLGHVLPRFFACWVNDSTVEIQLNQSTNDIKRYHQQHHQQMYQVS